MLVVLTEWSDYDTYEVFLVITMLWLLLGNIYFLHNATENF